LPGTVPVNVVNQDAAVNTAFIAQPITKLIAVNALVQIDRADENAAKAKLDKGTKDVLSGITQIYYGLIGAQRIQAALGLQKTMLEQVLAILLGRPDTQSGILWRTCRVQNRNCFVHFPRHTNLIGTRLPNYKAFRHQRGVGAMALTVSG
jgi:hypothetical protein